MRPRCRWEVWRDRKGSSWVDGWDMRPPCVLEDGHCPPLGIGGGSVRRGVPCPFDTVFASVEHKTREGKESGENVAALSSQPGLRVCWSANPKRVTALPGAAVRPSPTPSAGTPRRGQLVGRAANVLA